MAKQKKVNPIIQEPPQEKKEKKAAKKLILNRSLSLPNYVPNKGGGGNFSKGSVLLPGTEVTKEIRDAYKAIQTRIGGTTPIEKFCA